MDGWWVAAFAVLVILVVVQAVMNLALFRMVGVVLLRVGPNYARAFFDLPWGSEPPVEELVMSDGSRQTLGSNKQLVTFVSTTCGICDKLAPAIRALRGAYRDTVMLVCVIGSRDDAASWAVDNDIDPAQVCASEDQPAEFSEGIAPPYAVVVDEGRLHHGIVNDREMLESLLLPA